MNCSLLGSWSFCARDQPRHKQALKELLSDEQAHKPELGFLVNKARTMIAAPGPKKYCKHKGRCTFEGRFSSYSHQCDEFQQINVDNSLIGSNFSYGEALEEFYVMVQKESKFHRNSIDRRGITEIHNKWT